MNETLPVSTLCCVQGRCHADLGEPSEDNRDDSTSTLAGAATPIDDLDPSAVLVDDFLHHRKAQTGAAGFARDIWLERTAKYMRRETGAVVLNGKTNRPRLGVCFLDLDQFRANADTRIGSPRERVLRVDNQVVNYLPQLRRVAFDLRQTGTQRELERAAADLGAVQRGNLLDQSVQSER